MKKKVIKVKLYDVDWLRNGFCYRTTINVTKEQLKDIRETAKALGESIRYFHSGTRLDEYTI